MNNQNQQKNIRPMGIKAIFKAIRGLAYVCVSTIDSNKLGADYFVINDYDGLQLDSK